MFRVMTVIAALCAAAPAFAHEWYPWSCCSGQDCGPIADNETPTEEKGGFRLIDGRHIDYKDVKMSPDGRWHLCEIKVGPPKDRRILCVFGPVGAF